MMDTAQATSRSAPIKIGDVDLTILRAVNRYGYLTAAQLGRLLYPRLRDENRYAQRRLNRLAHPDARYLLRLRALPTPRIGSAPHVFTLAQRGRTHLRSLGIEVPRYYRPSEERHKEWNDPHWFHTLAAVDALVAAERLTQEEPRVLLSRLKIERELKRYALKVTVPPAPESTAAVRNVAVIPDGWFELHAADRPAQSFALEVDRNTHEQKAWRRKVAALAVWANDPYREAFASEYLIIAVLTPSATRRDELRHWTAQELKHRQWEPYSEIYMFTDASPVDMDPREFFFGPQWYQPSSAEPTSLLDPLPGMQIAGAEQVIYPGSGGSIARLALEDLPKSNCMWCTFGCFICQVSSYYE